MSTRTRFEKEAKGNSEMAYSFDQALSDTQSLVSKPGFESPEQSGVTKPKTYENEDLRPKT